MTNGELSSKRCVPCTGGVPPLSWHHQEKLLASLGLGWDVVKGHHLHKEYLFPDFAQALAFLNVVAALAEEEGHHPDLKLGWGKVEIEIHTHKIDGLTESDFILAAKIDRL
jgi:4a-hydroxytetrahydrobiopterin dehydratase